MSIERTAASYDTVARTYEDRFLDELDAKPRDRELIDRLAARTSGVVLDLGCGPGQIGRRIRDAGREVIGVDLSLQMATLASRRLDGAVVADLRALPFAAGGIGATVAFYSLIHLPRRALGGAVREMARILAPGGRVLVSAHEGEGTVEVHDFLGHEVDLGATFFQLDELETAARDAGLEVVSAERRPPYENEGTTVRLYLEATKPPR